MNIKIDGSVNYELIKDDMNHQYIIKFNDEIETMSYFGSDEQLKNILNKLMVKHRNKKITDILK